MKPASGLRSPTRSLQPPAPHHRSRPSSSRSAHGLQLTGLPRFHPANFVSHSTDSSNSNSPPSGISTPQQPASPRGQHRQYSEAQRQLYLFQRELVSLNRPLSGSALRSSPLPLSPKLPPLGSPGPVTPLELDEAEEYLVAGAGKSNASDTSLQPEMSDQTKKDIVDAYIKNEAAASSAKKSASNKTMTSKRR